MSCEPCNRVGNLLTYIVYIKVIYIERYPTWLFGQHYGRLAQLVERTLCMREVRGSKPLMSTFSFLFFSNDILVTWCYNYIFDTVAK